MVGLLTVVDIPSLTVPVDGAAVVMSIVMAEVLKVVDVSVVDVV